MTAVGDPYLYTDDGQYDVQVLDQNSGAGQPNPDRIYVPLTGEFSEGDKVWIEDDNTSGEVGTIQAIVADDYLDMVDNLVGAYTVAQNAWVSREIPIKYEAIRTNLGDALRDICELSGRDYYIDNNGRLHLFEAGEIDSTADLDLVADSAANNILTFEEYEQVGTTIKNYWEIHAGSVKDHYTNQGAYLFTDAAGATTTDEIHADYFGGSCLKIAFTAASRSYLDFAGAVGVASYSPSVDLRKSCEAKVRIKGETAVDYFDLQPYAYDTGGRKILFTRDGPNILSGKGSAKGWTERIQDFNDYNHWVTLSYPLGASTGNPTKATQTTGYWHADGWDPTIADFDWEHVERLGFEWPQADAGYVLLDAWSIPNLEARAIDQNAASIAANDLRMDSEYRKELKSQLQLEEYAAAMVLLRKDAIQKFKCVTKGEVKTKYAAQWVHVNVPSYGLNDVEYTINMLHHKLHNTQTVRGWDFVTEYELAEQDTPGYRVIVDSNPMAALMAKIRKENRGFKGGMEADDILLGDVISGSPVNDTRGTPFPLTPSDGDLHFLSADLAVGADRYYGPAQYWYDETLGDWYRNPIVMYRGGDPAAGGEVIDDELYRTDLEIWFKWTGVWTQMNVAATVITGTISATQLKKGIQPFDSSVLVEAIRVAATAAVTLAIDVNDGTGKAEITASAETPFSDFTAGDELLIQHCEDRTQDTTARTVNTVNGGGSSITLDNILVGADNADDETMIVSVTDGLKWTGDTPAVWFADGTTQNIANGSDTGLAPGTYWAIFTVGAGVTLTSTYPDAVGDTVGIIARVTVVFGREPFIFPVFTRGGSQTLDFLGAGVVDTILLTGNALIGKIMASSEGVSWTDGVGDPGTIMTRLGVKGKGAAGVTQFFLDSTDGKVYAGAGAVILDVDGLSTEGEIDIKTAAGVQWAAGGNPGVILTDTGLRGKGAAGAIMVELLAADGKISAGAGKVVLDSSGITIKGQGLYFTDVGDVFRGWIWGFGGANPYLQMASNNDLILTSAANKWIRILAGGDAVTFNPGGTITFADNYTALTSTTNGNVDLGTNGVRFGKLWANQADLDVQLTIPRAANAGEEAAMPLANGDIWLRTDL